MDRPMLGRRAVLALFLATAVARPAAATGLVDFARCISRAGAVFYTAQWCPHCARQVRMFGNAIRFVRTVDCTAGCDGVASFPTWRFADGSRLSGVASFDELASRTGCRLGEAPREEPSDAGSVQSSSDAGTRERTVAGAKIIEVPRR
jgi:hypothetical protein